MLPFNKTFRKIAHCPLISLCDSACQAVSYPREHRLISPFTASYEMIWRCSTPVKRCRAGDEMCRTQVERPYERDAHCPMVSVVAAADHANADHRWHCCAVIRSSRLCAIPRSNRASPAAASGVKVMLAPNRLAVSQRRATPSIALTQLGSRKGAGVATVMTVSVSRCGAVRQGGRMAEVKHRRYKLHKLQTASERCVTLPSELCINL